MEENCLEYDVMMLYDGCFSTPPSVGQPLCREFVEFLVHDLELANGIVFYAERDLRPGTPILSEAFRILEASKHVICVITESFLHNSRRLFWQTAVCARLLEGSAQGSGRLLPIAFDTTVTKVHNLCPSLTLVEILEVRADYLQDTTWLQKLRRQLSLSRPRQELGGPSGQIPPSGQHSMLFCTKKDLLLDNLELIPVLDYMSRSGAFSQEDVKTIQARKTHRERIERLIEIVDQRGHQGLDSFLQTLRSIQPCLYRELQSQANDSLGSSRAEAQGGQTSVPSPGPSLDGKCCHLCVISVIILSQCSWCGLCSRSGFYWKAL